MKFVLALTFLAVSATLYAQPKAGFEFAAVGYSTEIDVPPVVKSQLGSIPSGGGGGYYFGVTVRASKKISWRTGLNQWSGQYGSGTLTYTGIYMRLDRTSRYFYWGGGFDWSLGVSSSVPSTTPIIDYNNQFNIVLGLGPVIPIGKFQIKGFLGVTIPFSSIYNTGAYFKQIYIPGGQPAPDFEANPHWLPFFAYGIGLQYNFTDWYKQE